MQKKSKLKRKRLHCFGFRNLGINISEWFTVKAEKNNQFVHVIDSACRFFWRHIEDQFPAIKNKLNEMLGSIALPLRHFAHQSREQVPCGMHVTCSLRVLRAAWHEGLKTKMKDLRCQCST